MIKLNSKSLILISASIVLVLLLVISLPQITVVSKPDLSSGTDVVTIQDNDPQITVISKPDLPPFHQIDITTDKYQYHLGDIVHITVRNSGDVPVVLRNLVDINIVSLTSGNHFGGMLSDALQVFRPETEYSHKILIPKDDLSRLGEIYEIYVEYSVPPNDFSNTAMPISFFSKHTFEITD